MIEENGKNTQQDLSIVRIQKDIEFILKEITDIKTNHLHAINEEIKCLNSEIRKLKDELNSRPTWFLTFLVSLCIGLISFVLANFFVK